MEMGCTRCEQTGFLNLDQIPETEGMDHHEILTWLQKHKNNDVQVCDCCGDGEYWYGEPGEHYGVEDPQGPDGPYAYNGGLCECH